MKQKISSVAAQDILFLILLAAGLGWLVFTYRILISPLIVSGLLAYLLYPILTWLS